MCTEAPTNEETVIRNLVKETWVDYRLGFAANDVDNTGLKNVRVWKVNNENLKRTCYLKDTDDIEFRDIEEVATFDWSKRLSEIDDSFDYEKEMLLFYGAERSGLDLIIQSGLLIDKANIAADEKRISLAESSQKANQYAGDNSSGLIMLVVRVAMGKVEQQKCSDEKIAFEFCDSVITGYDKTFREIIIANNAQCFVQYVI